MSHWREVTIGSVCEVIAGQSPKGTYYNDEGNGHPFYQGKKEFGEKYLGPPEKWTTHITREAIEGDVLMSVRAPVGPINFARQTICIGRGLAAIRPKDEEELDRDFLFYMLLEKQDEIKGTEGAVYPSINKTQIQNIETTCPPLGEQKRIVAILDAAFAAIDTATAHAEQNLANARELFEAHLNAVFSGQVVGGKTRPLAELCGDSVITYGVIKLGSEVTDGVPCLRTSNVRWLRIELNGVKRIARELSEQYSRTILRGGEVLVNVRGTLGGVAVAGDEMNGWNVSREVAVVPVDPAVVNPRYLAFWIGTRQSQEWLTGVLKGLAYTGINIKDLRTLPIVVPQMEDQLAFVAHVEQIQGDSDQLAAIYTRKLVVLAELKQTILQKAFTGELTAEAEQEMETVA